MWIVAKTNGPFALRPWHDWSSAVFHCFCPFLFCTYIDRFQVAFARCV
jgi:hypothetical protein